MDFIYKLNKVINNGVLKKMEERLEGIRFYIVKECWE